MSNPVQSYLVTQLSTMVETRRVLFIRHKNHLGYQDVVKIPRVTYGQDKPVKIFA